MAQQRKERLKASLLLLAGMGFFGSAAPISKLVGAHFPLFTASLLRVALGAGALLPFVARSLLRNLQTMRKLEWLEVSIIALFGMVGFTASLVYGMRMVSGVAGSVIMSLTPALTALGAMLFMGSPLGWRRGFAIGLGIAGVIMMQMTQAGSASHLNQRFVLGCTLVLIAIACQATYTLVGKKATATMQPLFATFLGSILALPVLAALAWAFERQSLPELEAATGAWIAMLWWGLGALGAGSACWYQGLARSHGTTAAAFMAFMPLSALLLSYLVLGEPFRWLHLPGMALVCTSVGLVSHSAP